MAEKECPRSYMVYFILIIVYTLFVTLALVIYLVINRKYLGAGAIRIRHDPGAGTSKMSKKASKGNRRDEVTDYDVTMAQTDANTVG